jgi:hypothetical protein
MSHNANHWAPSLNDDPNEDATPTISLREADLCSQPKDSIDLGAGKRILKKGRGAINKEDIIQRIKEGHVTSVTKFLSVSLLHAAMNETIWTKEVHLAK